MSSDVAERTDAAPITIERIAIALDCSSVNQAALKTAVSLAAATNAQLHAVFVEDQCLYELARLPVAQEVSLSGRTAHPFEADEIRREISKAANAARRMVSDAATREQIDWAFDTMRGLLDETLRKVGETAEILTLGSSRAEIGRVHCVDVLRRTLRHGTGVIVAPSHLQPGDGPVLAVIGPGADPGTVIRTAENLSERLARRPRFAIACATAAERRALEAQVRDLIAGEAVIVPCDSDALASVTWSVRAARASIVIADIDYACFEEASSTERVSEAFGCPMLLIQV